MLDWGCGPCRTLRHFPDLLDESCKLYGTDYNPKTIEWCKDNIPKIHFSQNGVQPPLDYEDNLFDVIIGISIFTHLSEENHKKWYDELIRVTKPNGIILLTTQGDAFKVKMTEKEKSIYETGELVIRGKVKEGHRVFSAFHPPIFMQKLFSEKSIILEHKAGKVEAWGSRQDKWIIKKI